MKNIVVFEDSNSHYSKTFKILTSNEEYRPPALGLVADGRCLRIGSNSRTWSNSVVNKSDIINIAWPNKYIFETEDPSSLGNL